MAFKMKSGNKPGFKNMGSSPSPAKIPLALVAQLAPMAMDMMNKNKEKEESPGKMYDSPTKQKLNKGGEGQDQNKIFDKNGKHVGDYVNGKKVMKSTTSAHGQLEDAEREFKLDIKRAKKKKSPAKQKVDPDAPGTPGKPGYEPPVKREDLDEKGKLLWDKIRSKGVDPSKSKMIDNFDQRVKKKSPAKQYKIPVGPRAEVKPEELRKVPMTNEEMYKDDSIRTRISEGSIKTQELRRKENAKKKSPAKQVKGSGLGPRASFGGVKNPELVKNKKKPFSRKVMQDGKKANVVHNGKVVKGNWQAHQFKK